MIHASHALIQLAAMDGHARAKTEPVEARRRPRPAAHPRRSCPQPRLRTGRAVAAALEACGVQSAFPCESTGVCREQQRRAVKSIKEEGPCDVGRRCGPRPAHRGTAPSQRLCALDSRNGEAPHSQPRGEVTAEVTAERRGHSRGHSREARSQPRGEVTTEVTAEVTAER